MSFVTTGCRTDVSKASHLRRHGHEWKCLIRDSIQLDFKPKGSLHTEAEVVRGHRLSSTLAWMDGT